MSLIPIWAKLVFAAAVMATLYGAFAWWRHSIYQEGFDARDATAKVELAAEQATSDRLRNSIREQNRAVEALGMAKVAAEARGDTARAAAAANGKRLDLVLGQVAGARATTCAEAMPVVDAILQGVK